MAKCVALAAAVVGLCLLQNGIALSQAPQSDELYAAVRRNDLVRLRTLVGSSVVANAALAQAAPRTANRGIE